MHRAIAFRAASRGCSGMWAAAASLPLVSHATALVVNVPPAEWLGVQGALRWALAPDAVLYTATCAIVAAPLAGVAASTRAEPADGALARGSRASRAGIDVAIAVLLFSAMSSLLTLGWTFGREDTFAFVAESHVTLAAAALALAAWGALCASWFRHPLDAAAVSLVTTIAAAGGLLVAGAVVADLPRAMVAVGLTASPLVAIASAAQIDIVRMDLLYQISPLAHRQIDYPSWYVASGSYVAAAVACFLAGHRGESRNRDAEKSGARPLGWS